MFMGLAAGNARPTNCHSLGEGQQWQQQRIRHIREVAEQPQWHTLVQQVAAAAVQHTGCTPAVVAAGAAETVDTLVVAAHTSVAVAAVQHTVCSLGGGNLLHQRRLFFASVQIFRRATKVRPPRNVRVTIWGSSCK